MCKCRLQTWRVLPGLLSCYVGDVLKGSAGKKNTSVTFMYLSTKITVNCQPGLFNYSYICIRGSIEMRQKYSWANTYIPSCSTLEICIGYNIIILTIIVLLY